MKGDCKVCGMSNCWIHNPKLIIEFCEGLLEGTGYKVTKIE